MIVDGKCIGECERGSYKIIVIGVIDDNDDGNTTYSNVECL